MTGASIAGALRAFLGAWEHGYGQRATQDSATVKLFGALREDDKGLQSLLIVEGALSEEAGVEMRAGVRINPDSRMAGSATLNRGRQ